MQIKLTEEYLASQGFSKTIRQRFWAKVNKNGPTPKHMPHLGKCWIWTACCRAGYGIINRGGMSRRSDSANRVSWLLNCGPIPETLGCLHKCDNKACVRPCHLFLGTQRDNYLDCVKKGRANTPCGERVNTCRLTTKKVVKIRSIYPTMSTRKLALKFGMSQCAVWSIVTRKSWKHIQPIKCHKVLPPARRHHTLTVSRGNNQRQTARTEPRKSF